MIIIIIVIANEDILIMSLITITNTKRCLAVIGIGILQILMLHHRPIDHQCTPQCNVLTEGYVVIVHRDTHTVVGIILRDMTVLHHHPITGCRFTKRTLESLQKSALRC